MSNHELIHCFESDTLPGEFHHEDHVHLAFAYLCEFAPLEALQRFCLALKNTPQRAEKRSFITRPSRMHIFS